MDDIRHTMIAVQRRHAGATSGTLPTYSVGNLPRLGIAGHDDDDDIVQGIVLMRRGAQSHADHQARRRPKVDEINSSGILPPGVHIEKHLRPQRPDRASPRTPSCTT